MFSFPLSCRCTLPENPNNHTLQYWKDHNIVTTEVHWANLTVSVSLGTAGSSDSRPLGFRAPSRWKWGALQYTLVLIEIKLFGFVFLEHNS